MEACEQGAELERLAARVESERGVTVDRARGEVGPLRSVAVRSAPVAPPSGRDGERGGAA